MTNNEYSKLNDKLHQQIEQNQQIIRLLTISVETQERSERLLDLISWWLSLGVPFLVLGVIMWAYVFGAIIL